MVSVVAVLIQAPKSHHVQAAQTRGQRRVQDLEEQEFPGDRAERHEWSRLSERTWLTTWPVNYQGYRQRPRDLERWLSRIKSVIGFDVAELIYHGRFP